MIRFYVLGGLDLRDPGDGEITSLLGQPKRMALLSCLALAGPTGFQQRDWLLGVLWPELDVERGRGALRNALHVLRRGLGEGVVLAHGAGLVGLDRTRFWCDAAEFERALDRGDADAALALYRGDLLNSFYVTGALEFEHWLEDQRGRLRDRALAAAWEQADEADSHRDFGASVRYAQQALGLARYDERAVRRLITALARAGDRVAALRVYREFTDRLTGDLQLQPSEEMQALIEGVRSGPSNDVGPPATEPPIRGAVLPPRSSPQRVPSPGIVPRSRAPEPPDGAAGTAAVTRGRGSPLRVVALSLGVLLVAGLLLAELRRLEPWPASAGAGDGIVVFPFVFHGSDDNAYLAEGAVTLLSTGLQGLDGLRPVDPRAVLSLVEREGAVGRNFGQGRAIARRFQAQLFVLGEIVESGGRMRITAALYRAENGLSGGSGYVGEVMVEGHPNATFALLDQLAVRLVAIRNGGPGKRFTRLATQTTQSLPALQAFIEGEREIRAGRFMPAVAALERAVEYDTAFALAYYRLSSASVWTERAWTAPRTAARAVRFSRGLPVADSLLVAAWYQYQTGGAEEAERLYRQALAIRADDVEAWLQLGEVLFHWGPTLGTPAVDSRNAFERVVNYEPDNVGALIHLVRIAAQEGRRKDVDVLTTRFLRQEPDGNRSLEVRALRAHILNDTAEQQRIRALPLDESQLQMLARTLALCGCGMAAAEEYALRSTSARVPLTRVVGRLLHAQILAATGRMQEARASLAVLHAEEPHWALEYRAALATLPFAPAARDELAELQGSLRTLPVVPAAADAWQITSAQEKIHPPKRYFLDALIGILADHSSVPPGRLKELAGSVADERDRRYAVHLHSLVRATVDRREGRGADALAALGPPAVEPDSTLPELLSYSKAYERWLRAELLHELGRDEEALRWYATFPEPAIHDLMYLAPSHLRRAQIHERRGEREQAEEHYRQVIALWNDADPQLQPRVEEARARVSARARSRPR